MYVPETGVEISRLTESVVYYRKPPAGKRVYLFMEFSMEEAYQRKLNSNAGAKYRTYG